MRVIVEAETGKPVSKPFTDALKAGKACQLLNESNKKKTYVIKFVEDVYGKDKK